MTASRERRLYPLFSRDLAKSMTEEARRFVGDLVWNDRNFMDVFTAKYSFINSDLAAVYKTPPPARDFDRVEFHARVRTRRTAGPGPVPDAHQQARRDRAHRPRTFRAGTVPLPAGAASAARRRYEPAAVWKSPSP